MRSLLIALLLVPLPALADAPMTPQEFDAYTRGKILTFGTNGQQYGVEEYLPNRRVRWSFLDGKCKDGVWYDQGPEICFVYEDNPDPQCWLFYRGTNGLSARFSSGDDPTELYEVEQGHDMLCLGPEVGV